MLTLPSSAQQAMVIVCSGPLALVSQLPNIVTGSSETTSSTISSTTQTRTRMRKKSKILPIWVAMVFGEQTQKFQQRQSSSTAGSSVAVDTAATLNTVCSIFLRMELMVSNAQQNVSMSPLYSSMQMTIMILQLFNCKRQVKSKLQTAYWLLWHDYTNSLSVFAVALNQNTKWSIFCRSVGQ